MFRFFVLIMLGASFLFGAINLQTATKEELMSINGIGEKKANAIMEYRKKTPITKTEDLKNIQGFGDKIVEKIDKAINPTTTKMESTKK